MKYRFLFGVGFFFVFSFRGILAAGNDTDESGDPQLCETNWTPYLDEKCVKVFDQAVNFAVAASRCAAEGATASLLTIKSSAEQAFMSALLFGTHQLYDSVWLGLQFKTPEKVYLWEDGSELGQYANWNTWSPSGSDRKACIEMSPESRSHEVGKWSDTACARRNVFACQKLQSWPLWKLQKSLLEARSGLRDSLTKAEKELVQLKTALSTVTASVLNRAVPIGFIYVELPFEPSPASIWPSMRWMDISSTYSGLFFRVNGGNSASFGSVQSENAPRIDSAKYLDRLSSASYYESSYFPKGGWNTILTGRFGYGGYVNALKLRTSDGEVRPRNMAIKVWKRSA